MKLINSSTEYGLISKSFHWLSAAVLIIQIPLGMYLVDMNFSEKRLTIENIHVAVGISIFYLTILRLIYKTFNPTPNLNNNIFPGQKIIAKLNHVFLYISILMITISGALKKLYNGEELDMFFFNLEIQDNFDLAEIYETLSESGKLASFEAKKRFYEIGSHEGLKEMNQLIKQKKIFF